VTLRAVTQERRRPVLPDLPPTDDRLEPAAAATAPAPAPAALEPTPAPAAKPSPRPTASSRPAVGGARLDSLLRELTQNAPQAPALPAAAVDPKPESSSSSAAGLRSEGPRPARRFPWRLVLGVAGAGIMAAVALAGARGVGAALARPARTIDGNVAARPPMNNYDAWMAAQAAAGERVM